MCAISTRRPNLYVGRVVFCNLYSYSLLNDAFFYLYSQKVLVLVILFLLSFGITFYMLIDENVSV